MRSFFAKLSGGVQPEFLFDVRLIRFDCFHAQLQFSRQPGRAKAASNQGKNLQLAITKCFYLGADRLNLICRKAFQKPEHDACARIKMTF